MLPTEVIPSKSPLVTQTGFTMFTSIHVSDVIVIMSSEIVGTLKGVACETQHARYE